MPRIRTVKPELVSFERGHLLLDLRHALRVTSEIYCFTEETNLAAFAGCEYGSLQEPVDAPQLLSTRELPRNRPVGLADSQRAAVPGLNEFEHCSVPSVHPNADPWANVMSAPPLTRYVDTPLSEEEADELEVKLILHTRNLTKGVD